MIISNPQIAQTIGLEFECEEIHPGVIFNYHYNNMKMHDTHDASIETDYTRINSKLKTFNSDRRLINILPAGWDTNRIGTELVSGILDSNDDEYLNELIKLTSFLELQGEPEKSYRAGIHIHVSVPNPTVTILKSILRLGRYFESLFFHIGGMGYEFRGIKNDSTYCRPITRVGPPCVPYKRGWVLSFELEKLISKERFSLETFWVMYGDLFNHADRYTPVRYTWLNLFPMFPQGQYKGTLEFRLFNKTLNPEFIYAVTKMCTAFTRSALKMGLRDLAQQDVLRENSIFDSRVDTEELLYKFKELTYLEEDVYNILKNILYRTPQPVLEEFPIKSHLLDRRRLGSFWEDSLYVPEKIPSALVRHPNYVDIHVLNNEEIERYE